MVAARIVAGVRVALAVLFLWLALAGPWANMRNESFGVFDSLGGAGFGLVTVILGAAMLLVALALAAEHDIRLGPLAVGGSQLLLTLAMASFTTVLAFLIIVHSGAFRSLNDVRGAGWGAAGACLTAYLLPQATIMGFGFAGPSTSTPLAERDRRLLSFGVLVAGIVVVLSPLLRWFSTADGDWTGYQPGAPRMTFILLAVGAAMAMTGALRLRTAGVTEPAGRLAHPHLQLMAGAAIIAPVAGWMLTDLQRDDFSVGLGPWVALLAGAGIVAMAVVEFTRREVAAG